MCLLDHINLALMICLALTEVLGREEKDKSSESCGRRMLGATGEDRLEGQHASRGCEYIKRERVLQASLYVMYAQKHSAYCA